MRKFFLIAAILFSATAAQAGLSDDTAVKTAAVTEPSSTQPSSAQRPDDSALAAKHQAMMRQKQIMMRKQMAMQREMQLHPIRTRIHFGILKLKRKLSYAFR